MLQRADVADVLSTEKKRGRRSTQVRIAIGVLVVAALASGAGLMWFNGRGTAAAPYASAPVSRGDIATILTATGTLEPTQQVSVSSLVTGTISSVAVDYDQPVKTGDVLARLDLRPFDLRLNRAKAVVDAQAASRDAAATLVSDAEAALQRVRELAATDVASPQQLELATTSLARAKANLAAAAAQYDAAVADLAVTEEDYDKAIIVAPIDGLVLDVNAEVGQTINASAMAASLFVIASDLKRLDLEVDIDEADIAQVAVGDTANFTVEAMPDRVFTGTVRQVRAGPTVSNGITSYKAVIAVGNTDLMLRPGMTATADITTAKALGVLTVPNAALRFEPDDGAAVAADPAHVYLLRDGRPETVAVTPGLTDGQRTEVSGGLSEGDAVVIGRNGH
jgi:HlyD family secretion protein